MDNLSQFANWAQIISLPVAIIAIIVSVWLFRKSKRKKAVACIFDSIELPIEIKSGEALDGAIEILYKGKIVKNIFLVRAKIMNIGNISIRETDIVDPITFIFQSGVVILREPRTTLKKPLNLKTTWVLNEGESESSSNQAQLFFDLLNPGDEISIEFTCAGDAVLPRVMSRIDGVWEIESYDPEEKRLKERMVRGLNLPVLLIIAFVFSYTMSIYNFQIPDKVGWVLFIFICIFALFLLVAIGNYIWMETIKPLVLYLKYRRRT